MRGDQNVRDFIECREENLWQVTSYVGRDFALPGMEVSRDWQFPHIDT